MVLTRCGELHLGHRRGAIRDGVYGRTRVGKNCVKEDPSIVDDLFSLVASTRTPLRCRLGRLAGPVELPRQTEVAANDAKRNV